MKVKISPGLDGFLFFFFFVLFGGRYKKFCLKIILIWISHGITIFNTKEGIIICLPKTNKSRHFLNKLEGILFTTSGPG